MQMRFKALFAVAVLAALLSFTKFSHCQATVWDTPDQYIHACYSDLPSLFGERGMADHKWPYASDTNAVEYPVLTGLVMYATSFAAHSPVSYFNINMLWLALLFICVVLIAGRIKPEFAYLVAVAPAIHKYTRAVVHKLSQRSSCAPPKLRLLCTSGHAKASVCECVCVCVCVCVQWRALLVWV